MSGEEVRKLLAQGEGQRVEFKQEAIKPSDLAETLVAFANAQGGVVLLGVGDDGRPTGLRSPGQAEDLVLTAASHELCDPPVHLAGVTPVMLTPGLQVIAVTIPRSRRLHAVHGRFLVRRGARNVALTTAEIAGQSRRFDTGGLTPLNLTRGYQALYEVLRYDARLELLDAKGTEALIEREQEIRFLQNGVVGIYDQVWGEGELFAEYQAEPGVVADRFTIGGRHITLISLREIKNRGDVLRLHVRRRIKRGWTKSDEWFETAVSHRTHLLRLAVVFPVERPPRQASLVEESTGSVTDLDRRHWQVDEQGRWVLVWRKRSPPLGETYLLRWSW
jgi:hypothetical protein